MERVVIPFNEETKRNIYNIIETMKCPRKFRCVTTGLENLIEPIAGDELAKTIAAIFKLDSALLAKIKDVLFK